MVLKKNRSVIRIIIKQRHVQTVNAQKPCCKHKKNLIVRLLQALIRIYAFLISPFLGRHCRFYPTCASYAHQSLENHGIFKGIYLIFSRISRCHPWSKRHFIDFVPEQFAWRDVLRYKRPSFTRQCSRPESR